MIEQSDDEAANALLVWLGGSTSGGSRSRQRPHALDRPHRHADVRRVRDPDALGAHPASATDERAGVRLGKYTTAWDMSLLCVHLARLRRARAAARRRTAASRRRTPATCSGSRRTSTTSRSSTRRSGNRASACCTRRAGSRPRDTTRGSSSGADGVFVAGVMTWTGVASALPRTSSRAASRDSRSRASARRGLRRLQQSVASVETPFADSVSAL